MIAGAVDFQIPLEFLVAVLVLATCRVIVVGRGLVNGKRVLATRRVGWNAGLACGLSDRRRIAGRIGTRPRTDASASCPIAMTIVHPDGSKTVVEWAPKSSVSNVWWHNFGYYVWLLSIGVLAATSWIGMWLYRTGPRGGAVSPGLSNYFRKRDTSLHSRLERKSPSTYSPKSLTLKIVGATRRLLNFLSPACVAGKASCGSWLTEVAQKLVPPQWAFEMCTPACHRSPFQHPDLAKRRLDFCIYTAGRPLRASLPWPLDLPR
jgi:hypothetical protein